MKIIKKILAFIAKFDFLTCFTIFPGPISPKPDEKKFWYHYYPYPGEEVKETDPLPFYGYQQMHQNDIATEHKYGINVDKAGAEGFARTYRLVTFKRSITNKKEGTCNDLIKSSSFKED